MRTRSLTLIALLLLCLLTACGQRGPLYLPSETDAAVAVELIEVAA